MIVAIYKNAPEYRLLNIIGKASGFSKLDYICLNQSTRKFPRNHIDAILALCDLCCSLQNCAPKFLALKCWAPHPIAIIRPLRTIHAFSPKAAFTASFIMNGRETQSNEAVVASFKSSCFYACSPAWSVHPSRPFYKVAKTQRIVAEEHKKPCSLTYLSKQVGWSPTWLSACFKKYAGISLGEHINQLKFCYALWNVIATANAIKNIAYELGYNDPLYFSKTFKKRFGVSPNYLRGDEPYSEAKIVPSLT